MSKQNITLGLAILALILGGIGLVGGNNQSANLGASGTRFPSGISADTTSPVTGQVRGTDLTITDDATVASQFGLGTTSPSVSGDAVLDGSATTTLKIASSDTTKGGCIEIETVTGGVVRITVAGTTISAVAGHCK